MRCARSGCDWQPQPDTDQPDREQLVDHAADSCHGLCVCCSRSLTDAEPQTCERCLIRTQETLAGILLMWAELPRELGHARAQVYDRDGRGGGDEHALPGGTVSVLLGPGGTGQQPRRLTPLDIERGLDGREHLVDNQADDTPSVAWTLATWEDDWRHTRGEPAANSGGSTSQVVRAAAGYLERHTRWAANTHPAFDEYTSDLATLHARLETASGRVRRPTAAGADCFACGGPLIRPLRDEAIEQKRQQRPPAQWWLPGAVGPLPPPPFVKVARTGQAEVEEYVECRRCGERYTGARYLLALAARRQEGVDSLEGWTTMAAATAASGRSREALRPWLGRHVAWACQVEPRTPTPDDPRPWRQVAQLVWYPDVHERAQQSRPRATRRSEASA